MRDERTIEAELAAIERELEEAKKAAAEFNSPKERGNRAACLREILGAAAEARLQAGDPSASVLLAEGLELRPDIAFVGGEQVLKNDGYHVAGATDQGQVVWKKA